MEITYFVKIKCLKVKEIDKIDKRVICTGAPGAETKASEFRNKLKNNLEKEITSYVHDYPVGKGYKLTNLSVPSEVNALLISNNASDTTPYTPYCIQFFDSDLYLIKSIKIETSHTRNMFLVVVPPGTTSFDVCINDEQWRTHDYSFGFDCLYCSPVSDPD